MKNRKQLTALLAMWACGAALAAGVSAGLNPVYAEIARRRKHLFLAASDYAGASVYDDEHLNAEGHSALADAIYRVLSGSLITKEAVI